MSDVAHTILNQLGGNRFVAMTGSKNFVGGKTSLSFRVGRNPKGVSTVRVDLTASDDYTVTFYKGVGVNLKPVVVAQEVYCDMLQDVFLDHTGLYTSFSQ